MCFLNEAGCYEVSLVTSLGRWALSGIGIDPAYKGEEIH